MSCSRYARRSVSCFLLHCIALRGDVKSEIRQQMYARGAYTNNAEGLQRRVRCPARLNDESVMALFLRCGGDRIAL